MTEPRVLSVRDDHDAALTPGAVGSGLRVLVVDDDEVDRLAVRRALRGSGLAALVDDATDMAGALAALSRGYDCAFLDYNMPGTDGMALLRRVRQAAPDLPVVMLTGQGDEQVAVALMKAGAVDYLPKNAATPERITASLRYALELSRATAAARRAHEELRDSAARATFLAEASDTMARSLHVEDTLQAIARICVPRLGDQCVLYAAEDGALRHVATAHADPAMGQAVEEVERRFRDVTAAMAPVYEALRTGQPQQLAEFTPETWRAFARDEEEAQLIATLRPRSALIMPMLARGVVVGVICFVSRTPGAYDAAVTELAGDLAQRAAMALDNARLMRAATESAARTTHLQRVTAALADAADVDAVGAAITREAILPLGAYAGCIALRMDDELELRASVGYPEAACMSRGRRWPLTAGMPIALATRNAQPVFVASPLEWAQLFGDGHVPSTAAASRSQAWAALPLTVAGVAQGAILWTFDQPRAFSPEDRSLFQAMAQQCTQALERARLREAEHRARSEAENANRAKADFLARMSHDLRTPLNAIGGFTELVLLGIHGPVTDAQREALDRVRRAQEHLLTLINDILSFARLEAGQVELSIEPVPVHDALHEVLQLLEPQAAAKGLRLEVEELPDDSGAQPAPSGLPPEAAPTNGAGGHTRARSGATVPTQMLVRADRQRLQQVLLNLGTNAVKFTSSGTVTLGWRSTGSRVRLQVRDTGPGIPQDKLSVIFEPFVQGTNEIKARSEGVGLGLAISRELSRMMGGTLSVESTEGAGSVFTLELARA